MEKDIARLPRDEYKRIKGLDNEHLTAHLVGVYRKGMQSVYDDFAESIDYDELRERISAIKGIGAARLDEIMSVIEAYLTEVLSGDEDSEDEE